jgi:hypothetical protein
METMLIQLTNQKADKLLHELEELNIIKVLKKNSTAVSKLSERFAGKLNLSNEEYNQFQKYIQDSRNECDNRSI